MRTKRQSVTFHRPFDLKGLDGVQPPGTYLVFTDEEEIPGLSYIAWHRVETMFRLPEVDAHRGMEQLIRISPKDLAAALVRDKDAL